jgi:hypothetical protein
VPAKARRSPSGRGCRTNVNQRQRSDLLELMIVDRNDRACGWSVSVHRRAAAVVADGDGRSSCPARSAFQVTGSPKRNPDRSGSARGTNMPIRGISRRDLLDLVADGLGSHSHAGAKEVRRRMGLKRRLLRGVFSGFGLPPACVPTRPHALFSEAIAANPRLLNRKW